MKKKIVWLKFLIPFMVIGLIFAVGCGEHEPTEQPDIPRYTADQVIDVVKAQYPACFKREWSEADGRFRTVDTPSQISVQFIGGSKGAWKVIITCPSGYHLAPSSPATFITVYFWEPDGSLHYQLQ